MQASKLQLENYFVDEVSFRLKDAVLKKQNAESNLTPQDLEIEVRLGESKNEERKRFCQIEIKPKEKRAKRFAYDFRIVLVGFFELSAECSDEDAAVLINNTAPSMLYTAAREYLLTMTGRTRYLPILLPTVLFVPEQKSARARPGSVRATRTSRKTTARIETQ